MALPIADTGLDSMMCFLLRPVESIDFDPLISMSNSISITLILSIKCVYLEPVNDSMCTMCTA